MTESRHGGDDDDPQLRAMRAVWRAMPDEDPPSRGLAELMAAARVKAGALATPPWWRRVLDLFRRPMVLALASIMVLIGGAVLITQHRDQMVEPSVKVNGSAAMDPESARQADQTSESPPAGGDSAPASASAPAPRPQRELAPAPRTQRDLAPAPRPANPAPRSPPPAHAHATTLDRGAAPASTPQAAASATGFVTPPETQPSPIVPPKAAPAQAEAVQDDAATRGPKQVLVDELLQQCRSAATRGDCEAAKLIARRIAKQDASYYREHVTNDTTITKCVAPAN